MEIRGATVALIVAMIPIIVSAEDVVPSTNLNGSQNLFENPSFDKDASSWTLSPQSMWSSANHTVDNSDSGSVLVEEFISNPFVDHGSLSQCVPVMQARAMQSRLGSEIHR